MKSRFILNPKDDVVLGAEMFAPNTPFVWGISESGCKDDTVTARIIASNIAHKH